MHLPCPAVPLLCSTSCTALHLSCLQGVRCLLFSPRTATLPLKQLLTILRRSVLCLLFHGYSLGRLVWDERPIRFQSEDEEQLWRFMYRRCGMGRLEMKQARARLAEECVF